MKKVTNIIKSILNIRSWTLSCLCGYVLYVLYCANAILSQYIIHGTTDSIVEKQEPTMAYTIVNNFHTLLETSTILNYLTLILILVATGVTLYKMVKEKHKASFYSIGVLVYLIATLLFHPIWEYAATPIPFFTYDTLLGVVAVVVIITIFVVNTIEVFKSKSVIENLTTDAIGLSVNVSTDHQELGWSEYMNTLLTKINLTDISKEAFTVGISGQWGSGKTTFLQELEEQLKANDYIIVKFNPWNCHSSQQIITSFFNSLVSAMNVKKDSLGEALSEYGNLLADFDVHPLLSKLFQRKEKDVDALRTQLQDQMALSGSKISILIDDIDRLDQNEVYETLRLIRETANFANLVYFVAYDSRHVINMLAEKGITNGNEYIRKIFQMEIPLPGYESFILPMVLLKEIKKQVTNQEDFKWIQFVVTYTTQNGEYLIPRYLKNFRDIKRFVNSFIINYTHISTQLERLEYSIRDLMWLELLHYSDLETYQKLATVPVTFLISTSTDKGPIYSLRNEYSHRGSYVITEKKDKVDPDSPVAKYIKPEMPYLIHEDTATLLSMLFNLSIQEDASIRYIENYSRYFAYRLPKNNIGTEEFRNALISSQTSVDVESILEGWLTGFASKRQSLMRQMQQFELSTQNLQVCKNYLTIILYLIRTSKPGSISDFCRICLKRSKYPQAHAEELSDWFYQKMVEIIPTLQFPWTWVYICKRLYPVSSWFEDNDGNLIEDIAPVTLLSADQLKDLSSANFIHYMDWANHPSIVDITKRNTNLNSFVKESIVSTAQDPNTDETYSTNLIINSLIDYYSAKKSDQFCEFIRPLTPNEYHGLYAEDLEDIKASICKTFNSYQDFMRFVENCFTNTEEIEKYYRLVGLSK